MYMGRYTVDTERHAGETLYVLRESKQGAFARLWPDFGYNCLDAQLPAPDGRLVALILGPDALDLVRQQPSWWGVPLLFPWPGRIPRGEYEFAGHRYTLPHLDQHGNAVHGFVKDRPWEVDDAVATADFASLRCSFSSSRHPDTLESYPFPYRLTVTYRLDDAGLTMQARVSNARPSNARVSNARPSNEGDGLLPFGFGAHPYFRVPLDGPAGEGATPRASERRGACLIHVPASHRWDLPRLAALVPGERLRQADVTQPLSPDFDLRDPRPLLSRAYDAVYTGLEPPPERPRGAPHGPHHGQTECFVRDPTAGLEAVMQASSNFGSVVVYTPQDRPGVCFEPWTCPPNVFNLAARGVEHSGLVVLSPGEHWQGTMRLFLRRAPLRSGR